MLFLKCRFHSVPSMTSGRTAFHTMFGVIVLTLVTVSAAGPTTPIIYTHYSNKLLTWFQAAQYCADQGGKLATIPNEIAASVLQERLEVRAYIGLHKSAAGVFNWLPDCQPLGDYQPSQWHWRQGDDVCVYLTTRGNSVWTGWSCFYPYTFICETSGDECKFITYERKEAIVEADMRRRFEKFNDTACKMLCLTFYNNSMECIGYTYTFPYCDIYTGANLSVQLQMKEGTGTTRVKTCYTVQVNSDVITDDIVSTITKCGDASNSSIVNGTSEQDEDSTTTETASNVLENENDVSVSATSVDDLMTKVKSNLDSSAQGEVSMTTESAGVAIETEHAVISATTVDVTGISAKSVFEDLMTTVEINLGSSAQAGIPMTTESAINAVETENAAISVATDMTRKSAPSDADDELMTRTENNLESSAQDDVSVTTERVGVVMETEHAAISATTVHVSSISATSIDDDLMTTTAHYLESSAQVDVSVTTERVGVVMETEHAAISATTVPVASISATSTDDDLTTTTAHYLESSAHDDVSMTTETPVTITNNLESRSMYACQCGFRRSNISITKEEIVKALLLKTTTLSSFRRKKESAKDDRPSAQAVGQVGVALLIASGVIILLFDADVLIKFVKNLFGRRKLRHK